MSINQKAIGIALGGGGAKGLAHISILKVLDKLNPNIVALSGTSIGAIIGALYATGRSGAEVGKVVDIILSTQNPFLNSIVSDVALGWIELIDFNLGRNQLLSAERFLDELSSQLKVETFEELKIPLKIVATDFWEQKQIVFDSGPLLPALAASFCVPGVFKPVENNGRLLVDGGSVNPVPIDIIHDDCEFLIGIDVIGCKAESEDYIPSISQAVFNSFQIAERSIVREKLRHCKTDIFFEVPVADIKMFDFHKAEEIYNQSEKHCEKFEQILTSFN